MGARCILVGIGPEVAQALVASGANLAELTTRADLRNAVEYSIQTAPR
jgi:rsbT co-antagonist protein RsbR